MRSDVTGRNKVRISNGRDKSLKNQREGTCMATGACKHGCVSQKLKPESALPGVQNVHGHALKAEAFYENTRSAVHFCTTMRPQYFMTSLFFWGGCSNLS